MKTVQTSYTFGNLEITKTVTTTKEGILKLLDVSRKEGDVYVLLSQHDEDFSKAVKLMLNEQNK